MKLNITLILFLILISSKLIAQNTVEIGNQVWMTRNLDVDKFRNGDPIPEAKTDKDWCEADLLRKPVWCYYNNDPKNERKFGKLYNWFAVKDSRGLAPEGWSIPSVDTYKELFRYLKSSGKNSSNLKTIGGWYDGHNGTDDFGFSAYPSGMRNGCHSNIVFGGPKPAEFMNLSNGSYFWTTDSWGYESMEAKYSRIDHWYGEGFGIDCSGSGFSVRCYRLTSNTVNQISTSQPQNSLIQHDSIIEVEQVFTKVEIEASFPGGYAEWKGFLKKNLNQNVPVKKGAPEGTYTVITRFKVDKEGNLSQIETETQHGYGMEEEAIRVLKTSGKWIPAQQNGRNVSSYHRQSIIFVVEEK